MELKWECQKSVQGKKRQKKVETAFLEFLDSNTLGINCSPVRCPNLGWYDPGCSIEQGVGVLDTKTHLSGLEFKIVPKL